MIPQRAAGGEGEAPCSPRGVCAWMRIYICISAVCTWMRTCAYQRVRVRVVRECVRERACVRACVRQACVRAGVAGVATADRHRVHVPPSLEAGCDCVLCVGHGVCRGQTRRVRLREHRSLPWLMNGRLLHVSAVCSTTVQRREVRLKVFDLHLVHFTTLYTVHSTEKSQFN
jgi:hypothetical protein